MRVAEQGQETTWKVLSLATAALAAMTARSALKAGWSKGFRSDPPVNPASRETAWTEAVTWAVLVGAAAGLARLLARRGAAAGWNKAFGGYPKGL